MLGNCGEKLWVHWDSRVSRGSHKAAGGIRLPLTSWNPRLFLVTSEEFLIHTIPSGLGLELQNP